MIPFVLLTVAAISFVLTIAMVARDVRHRRYWMVCAGLMLAGFACWLAFAVIGSEVDAHGVLHEPFALVPLGWLWVGIGLIGSLIGGAMALRRRHARTVH
ncbi:DUF3955 domain-containing protein [Burkholderia pyrrocinia]